MFVAGGTGTTGSQVGTRHQVRPFDWSRPDTWGAAIGDSDAAYIACSSDLALPGAADQVGEFADVARSRGVPTSGVWDA